VPLVYSASPGPVLMALEGLVLPVRVVGPLGSVATLAQVDTGSSISSVDMGVLVRVGAVQTGREPVETISPGVQYVPLYRSVSISTEGGVALTDGLPGVLGDTLPAPVQVLVGRDVLSGLVLVADGPAGVWSLEGRQSATEPGVPPAVRAWLTGASAVLAVGGLALVLAALGEHEREVGAAMALRRVKI